ncbi:FtsX-like permease family protein [Puia dinghuensis]|uniref:ABC transporter permease n=1 Tax=Puia dinghuensis TaxID=1792502 RepID=A0A8J2UCD3_9BACT|nr:FtsX-like permease family protein [Puia dinghuensis]GGA98175.1 ABC transporter permease [Puia dinghuensis]
MLKNYWLIAWRTIGRNKIYTFINILGLALGICGCLVLFLITNYEFSFDRHHPDGDRIYRIVGDMQEGSGEQHFMNSPYDDLAGFETQIPGFAATAGVHGYSGKISVPRVGQPPASFDNHITGTMHMHNTVFTWPGYFDIFRYEWLAGSAGSLNRPNNVVLTESRGKLYFGDISPDSMIGKTVVYDDSLPVHVSGIVRDWKGNTDLGYTDFLSVTTATHSFLKQRIPTADWSSLQPHRSMAFVKLSSGVRPEQINARFAAYIKAHVKLMQAGSRLTMYLQPLNDLHYTPDFHRGDDGDGWRKPYLPTLYAMMGVAIFVLLIAAINFINLSTAQSMSRSKEVGIRRVMGSRQRNIRFQFLVETLVVTLFSTLIAILLVNPVLALFHDYVPEGVHFRVLQLSTLGFLFAMTVFTTLLAGFYPAWVLSTYDPVESLKGAALSPGRGRIGLRRALIVFQFVVSLIFIIGALVIGKQINYMNHADKGLDTDRVLTLNDWNDAPQKLQVYVNSVKSVPGVEKVLLQGTAPMGFAQNMDFFSFMPTGNEMHMVSAHMGNNEFIPFYKMRLLAGRNMLPGDSMRELVINVTMSRLMGCKTPQQALGRMLYAQAPQGGVGKGYPVVGVIADFHVSNFHEAIPPVVIENVVERKNSIAIKLSASEKDTRAVKAVIDRLEAVWNAQFPADRAFRSAFLDESITGLFDQEKKTAWLINLAMGVTIFISCMGLFGLGLFTVRRRAKEISIRKVLGASVTSITALLSRDLALLVGIAFCIATPLAWMATHRWLQDFAYRTELSAWIFAVAGLAALTLALLTVGVQAARAGRANPVNALRSE